MARPDGLPITPEIQPSAYLPALFPRPMRLHAGFFLALALAALVYWFLWKTNVRLRDAHGGREPARGALRRRATSRAPSC